MKVETYLTHHLHHFGIYGFEWEKPKVDSGLLYKDFSAGQDILDRRKNLLRCTTGSGKLDLFSREGVEFGRVYEKEA